jgi:hypothetical protein
MKQQQAHCHEEFNSTKSLEAEIMQLKEANNKKCAKIEALN